MAVEVQLALGMALPSAIFAYLCWTIDEPGAKHWAGATVVLWLAGLLGSLDDPIARTLALTLGSGVSILITIGSYHFARRESDRVVRAGLWAVPILMLLLSATAGLSIAFRVSMFVDSAFYLAAAVVLWPLLSLGTSRPERILPIVVLTIVPINFIDLWFRSQNANTEHSTMAMAGASTAIAVVQLFSLVHRVLHRERLARLGVEAVVEARTLELEDTQRELRHRERLAAIGTFAAGVAHQLNNPVGAIMLAIEATEADATQPGEKVLRVAEVNTIRDQAERCRRIVRGIMRFARSETSTKCSCDLDETLEAALAQTKTYAEKARARIEFVSAGKAPIMASSADLEEAFVNILRNAIESKDQGASVRVDRRQSAADYILTFADDGRGIPSDALHRVVEPFFSTRLRSGGTGLGLSVAHGIIESHHGTMSVESESGGGTAITIRLPR